MSRATGPVLLAVAVVAATGCASPPEVPDGPPATPEQAALAAIALAGEGPVDPDAPRLAEVFGDVDEDDRASLLDALAALAPASDPRIVSVEPLEGLGRVHVDVAVAWQGGGEATISAQVVPTAEGTVQVRWLQGPGVEWPAPPARRDDGISTSAPPDGS